MKSKLVLSAEETRLEPTAIMGNESGIYFTFMSDLAVIADILPEPLEPAFPLVSGYVVNINNPYVDTLKDMDNVYVIGEAEAAGRRIGDAVHAAYQLAYRL